MSEEETKAILDAWYRSGGIVVNHYSLTEILDLLVQHKEKSFAVQWVNGNWAITKMF